MSRVLLQEAPLEEEAGSLCRCELWPCARTRRGGVRLMHEPPRQLCGRAGTDLPGRAARAGAWTLARVRPALSQAARRARGGGRYIPAAGDAVVGTVAERHADSYTVELGAPFPGTLPALGFEGATRRNRPTLAPGDLVYARVAAASRDAGPELACTDASGKARTSARSLSATATCVLRNAPRRAGLHGAPLSRRNISV